MGDEDVEKLITMNFPTITKLDMDDNNIGAKGAIALSKTAL